MTEEGRPQSPMRFAYADPPYLGCGQKLYGSLHADAADYDDPETHRALIGRLCDEYPDGWAMSLHVPSLTTLMAMCPPDVRIAAWVKTFHQIRVNVSVQYAWEPVIWRGGRSILRRDPLVRDWCKTSRSREQTIVGQKPAEFSYWMFDLLGAEPDDEVHDLFTGSGAVSRAWETWCANRPFSFGGAA